MPNWSNTSITLRGKSREAKDFLWEALGNGWNSGITKLPKGIFAYTSPCKKISSDEWKRLLKEEKDKLISELSSEFTAMKKSVAERFLQKAKKRIEGFTEFEIIGNLELKIKPEEVDWYTLSVGLWGTKWNFAEEDTTIRIGQDKKTGETVLEIDCLSAWNGPWKWFLYNAKRFRLNGTFVDSEPGNDFFVKIEVKDGEVVSYVEDEYISSASFEHYGEEWAKSVLGSLYFYDIEDEEERMRKIEEKIEEFKKEFEESEKEENLEEEKKLEKEAGNEPTVV